MSTRTLRNRRLAAVGTMVGMALAVTAVPLTASALVTDRAVPAAAAASTLADDALIAMRDEERLAGDTYAALGDLTDAVVFTRIAQAEERHQTAVERLLTARGVDVAPLDDEPGEYAVDAYEDLYDEYLERGEQSLDDALGVGVEIEERDITDLEATLEQDLSATERQVVEALLRGSEHHLAAFTRALEGDYPDGFGAGTGPGPRWGADREGQGFGPRGDGDGWGGPGRGQGYGMQRGMGQGMGPGQGMGQGMGPGFGDCPYADPEPDSES